MKNLGPKKPVPLGRYRELPVPETWLEVLEQCKPFVANLALPRARDITNEIEQVFSVFDSRVRQMIRLRYGFQDGSLWTLAALGEKFGLTRERVRQVTEKAIARQNLIGEVRGIVDDCLSQIEGHGVALFGLPDRAPLKNCYIGVANLLELGISQLKTGAWVIFDPTVQQRELSRQLQKEPRFFTLEEAVRLSGLDEYELIHCHTLFEGAFLTVGGKLGSRKWTMPEFIEAIALELSEVGIREWHFSQMAQAMKMLLPGEYANLTSRHVAAVVARPESRFQNIGAKGIWRLGSLGDGFTDTKEAVISLMAQHDLPLHHSEILLLLKRPVRSQSLVALISREPEFRNFGSGFYGLLNKSYPDADQTLEQNWLLQLLADKDSILAELVEYEASTAGLSYARVRAVALLSKNLHYNYKANAFERAEVWLRRRFERWYQNRTEVGLPSDEILAFGIRGAIAEGHQQRLEGIAEVLGYEVPILYQLVGFEPEMKA